jgi:hypothetical protein
MTTNFLSTYFPMVVFLLYLHIMEGEGPIKVIIV